MYGKVTRVFPEKGYGFILGADRKAYFIHYSNLDGEHIEKGYGVYFKPFQNERSDYNAKGVIVINAPERRGRTVVSDRKKNHRHHRHHKPCNADRVTVEDKKFKRFVKTFLEEQKEKTIHMEEQIVWQNTSKTWTS